MEFRKGELERQLGTELTDSDVLNVFEFKQTYEWRIVRVQPRLLRQKRRVDQFDVNAAVLNGFNRVGDLDQLAGGFFRVGVGAIRGKFHQAISMRARQDVICHAVCRKSYQEFVS
jgi:hypothetical protein